MFKRLLGRKKWVYSFSKTINPKMDVIVQLEFKLANFEACTLEL